MAKIRKIYRCEICGNIVEVLHQGAGSLVCCGKEMVEMEEKSKDQGLEKHVPLIEITDDIAKVKVGDIPHPMEDTHYIEFVQLIVDDLIYTKYLKPGDITVVEFKLPKEYTNISALEYCNIHGLWKSN